MTLGEMKTALNFIGKMATGMTQHAPMHSTAYALGRGVEGERAVYNDQWMARYRRG